MRTSYPRRSPINHGIFTRSISGAKASHPAKVPQKVIKKPPPPKYRYPYLNPSNSPGDSANIHRPVSPKKPPPPPELEGLKKQGTHWINRWVPIGLSLATIFALGIWGGGFLAQLEKNQPASSDPKDQLAVSGRYNEIADKFDEDIEWDEKLLGLKGLRKKLARKARGDVLEVSIGTGRNLEFYDFALGIKKRDLFLPSENAISIAYAWVRGHWFRWKGEEISVVVEKPVVTSFTAVDRSREMLEIAHEKFGKLFPGAIGVRWVIGDAQLEGGIPPPPKNSNEWSGNKEGAKYDTILQTMGLCSVEDPVGLLKRFGELVKEEEGRILLLEHGRGRWGWLNNILDKLAEGHARAYGCWWNRDLEKIVGESGLEVVEFVTSWKDGGTVAWIELKKPKPKPKNEENIVEAVEASTPSRKWLTWRS